MSTHVFMVARIYATAIFDIAVAQKNINKWQAVLELFSNICQNSLMQSVLHKCLEPKIFADIFIAVYEDYQKNKIDIFGRNMICVIAENNRLLLIPMILQEFIYLSTRYMRVLEVKIISARPLQHKQLKKITNVMTKRLSNTINLVHNIDQSILGGIIICIGDTVIDGSIRGRILRLNYMLQF